jgi:hypothetical protein
MIEIWEPRYKDMTVLVAKDKIVAGKDVDIEITKSKAYKGKYVVSSEDVANAPSETMKTRTGALKPMKAIPFDKLRRVE